MGSGHGGTRDGVGGRVGADPRGQNVGAGGEDIDEGTEVGVRGKGVSRGGGTDSAGGGLGGGRVAGGVGSVVTGGDGQEDTGADHVGGGSVDGGRLGSTERHVGDDTVGAAAALGVGGDVVHARDDTRVGSGAGGVENLDSVQADLLGDTVGGSSNGSGDVGTAGYTVSSGSFVESWQISLTVRCRRCWIRHQRSWRGRWHGRRIAIDHR